MPMNDSFRLTGGARRINDLDHVIRSNRHRRQRACEKLCDLRVVDLVDREGSRSDGISVNEQLRTRFALNARNELDRKPEVDRHDFDSASDRAPEGCHPFRPVLAPDHDSIAFADSAAFQPTTKGSNSAIQLGITPDPRSKPVGPARGFLRIESFDLPN